MVAIEKQLEQKLRHRQPKLLAADGYAKAAVSLIFRRRQSAKTTHFGVDLLLMQRAYHDADPWSGQIAFPGGRFEQQDPSMRATAERETAEETGVQLQRHDYCGQLDDVLAPIASDKKNVHISGFVYLLEVDPAVDPNHEVAQLIWVALDDLLDQQRKVSFQHPLIAGVTMPGIQLDAVSRDGQPLILWGLSLHLLQSLVDLLALNLN